MKKLFLFFFAAGLSFSAHAQKAEAALPPPANPDNVKRESPTSPESQKQQAAMNEARFKNMRQEVKNLQAKEVAINHDESLTEEQRKAKLEQLQKERDQLAERMKKVNGEE